MIQLFLLLFFATIPTGIQANVFAYVATQLDNTVAVINTTTDLVIKTIPVTGLPSFLAITPDNKTVYVTCNDESTVKQIDVATNKLIGSPIPVADSWGIAITPNGKKVYVTQRTINGTVSVIDRATNKVTTVINVGSQPEDIAITPDGRFAYVTNKEDNTISKIDTATNSVVTTIQLNNATRLVRNIAITPDSKTVYVTCEDTGNVVSINVNTNVIGDPIEIGGNELRDIAITHTGLNAFVVNQAPNAVNRINLTNNTVQGAPILLMPGPVNIAITPDDTKAYVTDENGFVTPIILGSNKRQKAIKVGNDSLGIAITNAPLPPQDVQTTVKSNIFLNTTELVLTATWQPSPSATIVAYTIYCDDTAIATIPAQDSLQFITCVSSIEQAQQFSIASVDSDDIQSVLVPLVV